MKILCGVIVVLASFLLAESLVCNKCGVSLFGYCLNAANETCTGNASICITARTQLDISGFLGFNSQGCQDGTTGCNATTTGTFVGVAYNSTKSCCSTDNCNPVTLSSATANKMTFTAAISATVLATVLGSML